MCDSEHPALELIELIELVKAAADGDADHLAACGGCMEAIVEAASVGR